jgi:hypothetical protein
MTRISPSAQGTSAGEHMGVVPIGNDYTQQKPQGRFICAAHRSGRLPPFYLQFSGITYGATSSPYSVERVQKRSRFTLFMPSALPPRDLKVWTWHT